MLVLPSLRLFDRRDRGVGRVDALGHVPQPLAPDTARDRDLASHHQALQHLRDVAVVRPAGRGPGDDARVRDVARGERSGARQPLDDVAAKRIVLLDPKARALPRRPVGRAREVQPDVAHGPDERVVLEQRPVLLERPGELRGTVGRAEPAPRDEVCARRDRGGRIDLEERQPVDERQEVGRAARVEHLRTDGDAPGLLVCQVVDGGVRAGSRRGRHPANPSRRPADAVAAPRRGA